MITLSELRSRIEFWRSADRIAPDIPWSHWRLLFPNTKRALCESKFLYIHPTADFRYGASAVVCSRISIGSRVVIRPGTMLFADGRPGGAGITIEDDVLLGSGIHIYTTNHRFDDVNVPIIDQGHSASRAVVLKRGCWVGAACIILPGVTIGENAVGGAGSIVTKDVPARVVVAGNPARLVRNLTSENLSRATS